MDEIQVISLLLIVMCCSLFLITILYRKVKRVNEQETHIPLQHSASPDVLDGEDKFETIVKTIEQEFRPTAFTSEDDGEKQLLSFLSSRFPAIISSRGHARSGLKIDLVLEGTYAVELAVLTNEGRLFSLLDEVVQSLQDFSKMVVILVDIDQVPFQKIQEYVQEFEKRGVKTIVKKV